jgi:regulatory subunit for Cdc7p protein kinase
MTSRRVPLGNLPNATNSPFRDAGVKRARSHAGDQREHAYTQPPAKKLVLDADDQEARRHAMLRKAGQNPPTAIQRKPEAVRDGRVASKAPEKAQRTTQENLESIRQWQMHYKKVFPQIVFYYENIPDDVRAKISRLVQTLGAVSASLCNLEKA